MKKIRFIMVASIFLASLTFLASAAGQTKTITVTGKVADSVTQASINGATVLLSALTSSQVTALLFSTNPMNTLLSMNLKIDTTYSLADGSFSRQMQIDTADHVIGGIGLKQGYSAGYGYSFYTADPVDLGTIKLKHMTGTILTSNKSIPAQYPINNMCIYSLQGQLLYAGPIAIESLDKVLQNRRSPIIVNFRSNNLVVSSRKIVPTR